MLEEFDQMLKAQRSSLEAMEQNEKDLMEVRNDLNNAIRNVDDLDVKDLVLVMMMANSAMLASQICSNQSQVVMAKQALLQQETIIGKIKKKLGPEGLGIFGGPQE